MKKSIRLKRMLSVAFATTMLLSSLTACSQDSTSSAEGSQTTGKISVVSREDGSGTRGAFVELLGIEDENGDAITPNAEISNSTSVVMSSVIGNPTAIGYISLGSLASSVKAIEIDGVEPSAETIADGTYKVARPFNLAVSGELSEVAQNFVDFVMSNEGQAIVQNEGYIKIEGLSDFAGVAGSGKIVLAGSTSVSPVIEVIREAYLALNQEASIEIQQSGSSSGMTSAIEGVCDIGMASRELKDSEIAAGLTPIVMALDGIAVIVNTGNSNDGLTSEQVSGIYMGDITDWSEIQ